MEDPAGGGAGDAPVARTYTSESLTLSYVDWGNAGAPPLMLVHGMSDHARSWDAVARALRHRFHVVAPDLRGHGDSAWSPDGAYLQPYHVLDLDALATALGGAPLTIVAHSFGGSVATRYAALFPDRVAKLVVVDGLGPSPAIFAQWEAEGPVNRLREWVGKRQAANEKVPRRLPTLEDAAARMRARNGRLSDRQALHLARHGAHEDAEGYRWKFDPRVGMFAPEDFHIKPATFWREVTVPTLLISGAESWTGDPAENGYAANFPDARVVSIAEAGHWPHHDQFDAFMAALDAFL